MHHAPPLRPKTTRPQKVLLDTTEKRLTSHSSSCRIPFAPDIGILRYVRCSSMTAASDFEDRKDKQGTASGNCYRDCCQSTAPSLSTLPDDVVLYQGWAGEKIYIGICRKRNLMSTGNNQKQSVFEAPQYLALS